MYDLIGSKAGASTGSPANPYFDNCNWWNQNLTVSGNMFVMNANPTKTFKPGSVTNCTAANGCGYMVLYASSGACTTGCFWSPYANEVIHRPDHLRPGSQRLEQQHLQLDRARRLDLRGGRHRQRAELVRLARLPYHQDAGSTLGR